jgi:hypothetical protein
VSTVPTGTYDGGHGKAQAAICRKGIAAELSGSDEIEVWGRGNRTCTFKYIHDCITGWRQRTASQSDWWRENQGAPTTFPLPKEVRGPHQ